MLHSKAPSKQFNYTPPANSFPYPEHHISITHKRGNQFAGTQGSMEYKRRLDNTSPDTRINQRAIQYISRDLSQASRQHHRRRNWWMNRAFWVVPRIPRGLMVSRLEQDPSNRGPCTAPNGKTLIYFPHIFSSLLVVVKFKDNRTNRWKKKSRQSLTKQINRKIYELIFRQFSTFIEWDSLRRGPTIRTNWNS